MAYFNENDLTYCNCGEKLYSMKEFVSDDGKFVYKINPCDKCTIKKEISHRKIVDYKVIIPTENRLDKFEEDVKNHLKNGWELKGNPAFAIRNFDQYICFQAMVKYED